MYKRKIKTNIIKVGNNMDDCVTASSNNLLLSDAADVERVLCGKIPDRRSSASIDDVSSLHNSVHNEVPLTQNFSSFNKKHSFMTSVLSSCGMILTKESNELRTDQAIFIRNLNSEINKSGAAEKFMNDFLEYHNEKDNLIRSLSSCVTADDNDIVPGTAQDSLIRLLLEVDSLQSKMVEYVLDKLGEYALEELSIDEEPNTITWIRILLQPLRFLNCVIDSKTLCERLFDIIHTTTDNMIQQEIITSLPDIISDNDHYFATSELSKLLRSSFELTPSILDALNNLSVQSDLKNEVRQNMILTLHRAPADFLPNIVKFLILTSDTDSYDKVINGLRSELLSSSRNISSQQSQIMKTISKLNKSEIEQLQLLIFGIVRDGLLASKQLADFWLRNISEIEAALDYRPIDIIVLLILHNIARDVTRKRAIENIFKTRIKNGRFKVPLIENTFEKFYPAIKEYYSSLLAVLSKLLVSPDMTINDFAAIVYMYCFKYMSGYWCKILITELLAYIGAGDIINAQTALNVLSTATTTYPEKIKPFCSMLGVLLNKLTDLSLAEVQQLMDMLCFIAFSSGDEVDTSLLQDELNIVIQKQLASSKLSVLRNGILGAVMAIKHIATVPDGEPNEPPDRTEEQDEEQQIVLTERANKAYSILAMIIKGTESNPDAQGLFFDQFSLMIMKCKKLDLSFLTQISMVMKRNLKMYFLIEIESFKPNDFMDCSPQLGLTDNEIIALNLTPILIDEIGTKQKNSSMLHSLFRLIRSLEFDDLTEIDALLNCPVVIPTLPAALKDFASLSPEQQVITMDSLFHLVNWFREVVNCFAYMIRDGNGDKVILRLRAIVWLQKQIAKCLPQVIVPDYCPPKCQFHTTAIKRPNLPTEKTKKKSGGAKGTKKGKKIKKNTENDNTINQTMTQLRSTQKTASDNVGGSNEFSNSSTAVNINLYKQFFRDLDVDIWILLSLPLVINPEPEQNCIFTAEFGPMELLFVLEDYVEKLELTLAPNTKRRNFKLSLNSDIAASSCSLYIHNPNLIVRNSVKLLPNLCRHLETIQLFIQNLLQESDSARDSTCMYIPETQIIKKCFSCILKSMNILFNWECFNSECNEELLLVALRRLDCNYLSQRKTEENIRCCLARSIKYFITFKKCMLHLETAVSYVTLIDSLNKFVSEANIKNAISDICWKYLTQRWVDLEGCEEKGASYNKNIEMLLTTYFDNSVDKWKAIESITSWLKEEVSYLTNKESLLKTLPTINRSNLNIVIRVICKSLENAIKENLVDRMDEKEKLLIWEAVTLAMECLVAVVKIQDLRPNLISFVKGSIAVLKLFHTKGLPTCTHLFRTESILVSQTLKRLQVTTRCIHNICNFTKVTEDVTLNTYLPMVRSLLESIILKVKNIFILNGCNEAFCMGSMRNKDLKGKELLSQSNEEEENEVEMEYDNEPNDLNEEEMPETMFDENEMDYEDQNEVEHEQESAEE